MTSLFFSMCLVKSQVPSYKKAKTIKLRSVIIRTNVTETQTKQTEWFNNCVITYSGELIIISNLKCKSLPSEDI